MSSHLPQQIHEPRRIRPLPRQLANQIAAGEVIERPASVVKELVENSIDADSTQIDIVIERGGSQLIQVSDNGYGIAVDDLAIALAPHATSKIYTLEELNQILSLGFRGEALASIASISRLTLQSRQSHQSHQSSEQMGWMITESEQEPQPCAIPAGSRIAVREIFFNTPGRKRFLRTERTEYLQIEAMVRRLALSHFEIGFSLEHNGKSIFRLPAATTDKQQLQRLGQLFGKSFVESALQIRFEAAGMVLSGWIGAHDYSIAQSDRQYFFLNGRGMRDKVISHAIRHAYQEYIPEGRYPAYLLNLEIDPQQVDVNVHPTKHEVRFRQGRMVHDFITTSLHRVFEEGQPTSILKSDKVDFETGELYPEATPQTSSQSKSQSRAAQVAESTANYRSSLTRRESLFAGSDKQPFTLIKQRYLLFISKEEHYLCDLKSLFSRVVDEAFAKLDSGELTELESQSLLFPERIKLSEESLDQLSEELERLSMYGVGLERLDRETAMLRSLPKLLSGTDYFAFIRDLATQWNVNNHAQLVRGLIKQYGVQNWIDPNTDQTKSTEWLKRFSMNSLSQLIPAKETLKLGNDELGKLFN